MKIERRKTGNGVIYRLPSWHENSPMSFHVFCWKDYFGNIQKESRLWLRDGKSMNISRDELAKTIKEARNAAK